MDETSSDTDKILSKFRTELKESFVLATDFEGSVNDI